MWCSYLLILCVLVRVFSSFKGCCVGCIWIYCMGVCNTLYVCVCMIWINCLLYLLESHYTFCIVPFGTALVFLPLQGAKPLSAHQISYYCQTRSQLWHIWHHFCYKLWWINQTLHRSWTIFHDNKTTEFVFWTKNIWIKRATELLEKLIWPELWSKPEFWLVTIPMTTTHLQQR